MLLHLRHCILLLKRLGIILIIYSLIRVLFILFNNTILPSIDILDIPYLLFVGLRFDLSAVTYFNVFFIFLHIFPNPFFYQKWFQFVLKVIFYVTNTLAICFSLADLVYFRYTLKRTTSDVFSIKQDFLSLLPQYFKDFWYLIIILSLLLFMIYLLYKKTEIEKIKVKINYYIQLPAFILLFLFFIIAARGGFQYKPITPISAAKYVRTELIPVITNTPFTLIHSLETKAIEEKNYFKHDDTLRKYFNPVKNYSGHTEMNRKNIMIIVLESFSSEYIKTFNPHAPGITPFIDSLSKKSLLCTNFYANGKHSNQGIVAIVGGIPVLMNDPFVTSSYQGNSFDGLGTLLSSRGYSTAFFHGGHNGTMNFDYFTRSAGFEKYFGKNEYPNDSDYDGSWGIFDEPFFKYTVQNVSQLDTPFCAALFSISSHHPYTIPESYQTKYEDIKDPILKTIAYTDHALKIFFEEAAKTNWFQNTIFIITADHSGQNTQSYYQTRNGIYRIPLLIYNPNTNLKKDYTSPVQQIDIIPSLLDLIHYDSPFISFGNSLYDSSASSVAYSYLNNIYHIIDNSYLLLFDGNKSIALYKYQTDSLLKENILNENPAIQNELEKKLKAIIQTHDNLMIENKLSYSRFIESITP